MFITDKNKEKTKKICIVLFYIVKQALISLIY